MHSVLLRPNGSPLAADIWTDPPRPNYQNANRATDRRASQRLQPLLNKLLNCPIGRAQSRAQHRDTSGYFPVLLVEWKYSR